ncbi:AAA domain-containing protein [Bradyrhizobium cosmicum]|uniref:AAA domain-containing protein n=1 Tax=Bradyrhizobium cosmicum TaxID=1404864 RepID=UPI0002E58E86|nr:AAA domain-containing protein [Bradyrhizobium cosmicum]
MTVRDDIVKFLRDPLGFSASVQDPDVWLAGLESYALPWIAAKADRPLRPAQEAAWRGLATCRSGLVLGPPGTGKTHLLSWLVAGYAPARRAIGLPARTFVTAFTKNAIGNVLDAVVSRQEMHEPNAPRPIYFGLEPAAGLSAGVDVMGRGDEADLFAALASGRAVIGATIWSLYRLLDSGRAPDAEGPTAPLFDLICIDEASQMVLGQGLMALGGLAPGGRVIVSGDDQQLPPVRAARDLAVGGRQMGGSLYAFMKSATAREFALEETFRLNQPLADFPEQKFYPSRYVSANPTSRLVLRDGWMDGLDHVTRLALDPAYPVVVLLHDGPTASTSNAFEASLSSRLATALASRSVDTNGQQISPDQFWSRLTAIVSPHRAQNALIRNLLPEDLRPDAFVETVDRIQGKERDVVILSYCVGDPEFALAEAEFIFSPERLNVSITRARHKLIMLVSKRLLDAVPTEQELMDNAETLREFVFSCIAAADVQVDGPGGRLVNVQIRLRGFPGEITSVDDVSDDVSQASPKPDLILTPQLEGVLAAIRQVVAQRNRASAPLSAVKRRLARQDDVFGDARSLHQIGWVSLQQPKSQYGYFWSAAPFDKPRRVYSIDLDSVRSRIAVIVRESKSGRYCFYDRVRDRFSWMTAEGEDALLPVLKQLQAEQVIIFGDFKGSRTIALAQQPGAAPHLPALPAIDPPGDPDFEILNRIEDIEAARINFGVVETWISVVELARSLNCAIDPLTEALARLEANGYLMLASEGRVRSRVAEIAREVRHVKQRFRSDDAGRRPYLVRGLKVEFKDRTKPARDLAISEVFERASNEADSEQRSALKGLERALTRIWGPQAALAQFQERGLRLGLAAWRGEANPTIAIAADTGSGKTEAACLPLIVGALADRIKGVRGTRAILAYPRIRLVANQSQRLATYLAACSNAADLPLLTLGLQVKDVPDTFKSMHPRYQELWPTVGTDAFRFPFFACPNCGQALNLLVDEGLDGADQLVCVRGDWRFDGWIGSKEKLRSQPPTFFLPTTDSLHQWMHDVRAGKIFGDGPHFASPRAILADEIHLYTHIHGAQVGVALRRVAARSKVNDPLKRDVIAIGMSATMGNPSRAWGRLIGRDEVTVIRPEGGELRPSPRGREYFFFVQPSVESRGADIAGASTTIQSLMCIGHGMRRRTGDEGGYRALVFFDSIDKMRRLHGAYIDAEEGRDLAAYRITAFGDDTQGAPQTECCRDPVGCDRFRDGECWWFAANDDRQYGASGYRPPGTPLRAARAPIYSGTSGDAEALVKGSDVVFATSSLEVGYDDPDITLVYQHYAPQNLASFIQRKGRAGRSVDDRALTAVTLSIYSPRDTWYFRRPNELVSPFGFQAPLNPENAFVRRGQALSALFDGLAWIAAKNGQQENLAQPAPFALAEAGKIAEEALGPNVWRELGFEGAYEFWIAANKVRLSGPSPQYLSQLRETLPWAPTLLFDTINLPSLEICGPDVTGGKREDISLAFPTIAPGNATRRYSATAVYWRTPVQGNAPWFIDEDYGAAERIPLTADSGELLQQLPTDARDLLAGLHTELCRPTRITLSKMGWMAGAHWTGEITLKQGRITQIANPDTDVAVRHDSRGELRGFVVIKLTQELGRDLERDVLPSGLRSVTAYAGFGASASATGLEMARVFWGADAEVRLDEVGADPIPFTQTFVSPRTKRPLLHGYKVETEGLQFQVDSGELDRFVASELMQLNDDEAERRWRTSQFTRYVVESSARGLGLNAYEAKRGADLLVAAAGEPALRKRLNHLLRFWSDSEFAALLEDTRAQLLQQHPLMTRARVQKTAAALVGRPFQVLLQNMLRRVADKSALAGYVRSLVLNSMAIRLKELVSHVGQGDERRLLAHAKLPIQFGEDSSDTITVCEAGSLGDGTIRAVIERWDEVKKLGAEGFLTTCANAEEDAITSRFWALNAEHDAWRNGDPRDPRWLGRIAQRITPNDPDRPIPAQILRILFDSESVEAESFSLYEIAQSLENVKHSSERAAGRRVLDWELASAAVASAKADTSGVLHKLYRAYETIDANNDESLSPDARLAEQAYRLISPLCLDGCRGCVHQPNDLMSDSLSTASVSRNVLQRFFATAV